MATHIMYCIYKGEQTESDWKEDGVQWQDSEEMDDNADHNGNDVDDDCSDDDNEIRQSVRNNIRVLSCA